MEELINEISKLVDSKFYISAINLSLTIPDICGAIDSENGEASGLKYKAWVDKYISPKYCGMINGDDIYKIRCATLHQGVFNHKNAKFENIVFKAPGDGNVFHCNVINNNLTIQIEIFVKDIIDGYYSWLIESVHNENYINNIQKSFVKNPNGFPGLVSNGIFIY